MTPASRSGSAAAHRKQSSRGVLRQVLWTSVPIWSIGFLSFVLGKFSSADELCAYTSLPPGRIDEVRDLMLFS